MARPNRMFVPLNTLQLLVVDDQTLVRTAMRHMLTNLGAKHITDASSGEEALEFLSIKAFDLVISDIDMTPINGLQLLKHIRCGDYGLKRDTLLVMLTGVASKEFVVGCVNLDVNAFLTKPPKKELLMSRIQYAFTTPFKLKEAAIYKAIGIPELLSPSAPAARANAPDSVAVRSAQIDHDADSNAQQPGMHYIIWTSKLGFGIPSMDAILQEGALLLNRAYVDKAKPLDMADLDAFVRTCSTFANEKLRLLEENVALNNEDLTARFTEARQGLCTAISRIRLIMQASPDIVMYEVFSVMKIWWHRTLDLITECRNSATP